MWTQITVTDLDDYLVAAQVAAYRQAALAPGQDDPWDEIYDSVAGRVRAECAAGGNVLSMSPLKVPKSLKKETCYLILEALANRLNFELTEDQRNTLRECYKYLERIARGAPKVEMPDDPEVAPSTQSATGSTLAKRTRLIAQREHLSGL